MKVGESDGPAFEGDYMGPIVILVVVDIFSDVETWDNPTDRGGRKPTLRRERPDCERGEPRGFD